MGHRVVTALTFLAACCSYLAGPSSGATTRFTDRASGIVLGSRTSFGPHGRGWGAQHPSLLDDDGDPSGHAWNIRWTGWGTGVARGSGFTYVPGSTAGSGYRIGRLELRASRIGRCTANGPHAYTLLQARVAPLTHGSFSAWQRWNGRSNVCRPPG